MAYFVVWTTNRYGHGTDDHYIEASSEDSAYLTAMETTHHDYIEDIEEITEQEYYEHEKAVR